MPRTNRWKLAIIVMAHQKPQQLAQLLSVLRHPRVQVYLHLDRRAPLAPFTRALSEAGVSDPVLLRRRTHRWGGIGIVDATMDGLAQGVADGCGYFLLISGQDFPVRPVDEIVAFADQADSRSYMEHSALPLPGWRFGGRDRTDFYTYTVLGRRETCIPRGEDTSFFTLKGRVLNEILRMRSAFQPRRSVPPYVRPFGGSNWWNLSRAAADHVLHFVDEHPDYRRYHEHTLIPSELFFHCITVGTGFAGLHEIVNDDLRFTLWPEGGSHPRTLTTDDLPAIVDSGKQFARKFDTATDGAVVQRLTEHVTA
jgi:hypothetical protein